MCGFSLGTQLSSHNPKTYIFRSIRDYKLLLGMSVRVKGVCVYVCQGLVTCPVYNPCCHPMCDETELCKYIIILNLIF